MWPLRIEEMPRLQGYVTGKNGQEPSTLHRPSRTWGSLRSAGMPNPDPGPNPEATRSTWHQEGEMQQGQGPWESELDAGAVIRCPLWGRCSEPPLLTWLTGQGVRSAALTPSRKPAGLSHIQVTSYLVI